MEGRLSDVLAGDRWLLDGLGPLPDPARGEHLLFCQRASPLISAAPIATFLASSQNANKVFDIKKLKS